MLQELEAKRRLETGEDPGSGTGNEKGEDDAGRDIS
jgi:hypothetical protein